MTTAPPPIGLAAEGFVSSDKMANELIWLSEAAKAIAKVATIGEAKAIGDRAAALKIWAAKQGWAEEQKCEIAEIEVRAARRLGELLPPAKDTIGRRRPIPQGNRWPTPKQIMRARLAFSVPAKDFEDYIAENKKKLDRLTITAIARIGKRAKQKADLEDINKRKANELAGLFDVLVIDPPWPMAKIERDCAPNQVKELDYPTMTLAEISAIKIPAAETCHLWLWTTHKFLPNAFAIGDQWGFKYSCTFVWHKAGGFQPVGLPQFNSEFALYFRKGAPIFLDTKDFKTCFQAPRGKHSEKPEEFYAMVRRVTGGRRADLFNRRPIEGFEGWGNEA